MDFLQNPDQGMTFSYSDVNDMFKNLKTLELDPKANAEKIEELKTGIGVKSLLSSLLTSKMINVLGLHFDNAVNGPDVESLPDVMLNLQKIIRFPIPLIIKNINTSTEFCRF